jgi:hypothetical protein
VIVGLRDDWVVGERERGKYAAHPVVLFVMVVI